MLIFTRLRSLIPFCPPILLLAILYLIPLDLIAIPLQVIVESLRVALTLVFALIWLGWAFGGILLSKQWKIYEPIIMPLVGAVILIPASYLLNFFWGMETASIAILLVSVPFGINRMRNEKIVLVYRKELSVPLLSAFALFLMALLPHVIQGSLGLLALSIDEETYFYLAQYLNSYPAGASMPGPLSPIFGQGSDSYRAEGWGFQYLLAIASSLSGVPTFHAYLPTSYVFLALSVPAWYLFFREVLRLSPRWAGAAVIFYALHGLPLWFSSYGYARQTVWIALTPLALSTLTYVIRHGSVKDICYSGIVIGSLLATESRVGITHMVVTLAGLVTYILASDRRVIYCKRLLGVGIVAGVIAMPAIVFFLRSYLISGGILAILKSGQSKLVDWGPNISTHPPIEVCLGLEPSELAKVPETGKLLSWLSPLNDAMTAITPFLSWAVLLIVIVGLVAAGRRTLFVLALTGGFFLWMVATRTVLHFPYGYFKLFGVGGPILLGFFFLGISFISKPTPDHALPFTARKYAKRAALVSCVIVAIFLVRNSYHSVVFAACGWGLSIPPPLVRAIADFENLTEPNSQIYITSRSQYKVSEEAFVQRKVHRLGIQSREEQSIVWSDRTNAMLTTSLIGRQVFGVFNTEQWNWTNILPGDDYDYYVLTSDEDPRLRGLDVSDVISVAGEIILYRSPGDARAGSERILANRGTLRVDEKNPLLFTARSDGLAFSSKDVGHLDSARGRVRIALLSLNETTVTVSVGGVSRSLALDPGLSWYTTPTVDLPAQVGVVPSGDEPLRVVALRLLPPGDEDLDRCADSILSTEVVKTDSGIVVELWLSNPMRDASKAFATVVVDDSQIPKWKLPMEVSGRGQSLSLHFPLDEEASRSVRDGVEIVPVDEFPWLTGGGGLLQLRFELGHERPRVTPLANVLVADGKIERFDRYVDPVQHRLWGHDDRPQEKQPPDIAALEGELVKSADSLHYVVSGGQRCWVPDPVKARFTGEAKLLTPEQLWLIPPGLPLEPH